MPRFGEVLDYNIGILETKNKIILGFESFFKNENPKGIIYHLKKIPDFRRAQGTKYPLYICLAFVLWGFMSGCKSMREIASSAQNLEEQSPNFFEMYLDSKHGVPSHDTLSRVLRKVNQEDLLIAFLNWTNTLIKEEGYHIAIDGKAILGAKKKCEGQHLPPYILNVFDVTNNVLIAQFEIENKNCEISTIPVVIAKLEELCPGLFEGTTITTDGIGTQKKIFKAAEEVNATIVSPVKDNQETLKNSIKRILENRTQEYKNNPNDNSGLTFSVQTNRKEHGRTEIRVCKACLPREMETIVGMDEFGDIACFGEIIRFREELKRSGKRKYSVTRTIYQSTAPMDAEELLEFSRNHWRVEVNHWHLDNQLQEDRSTANCGEAMSNLSLLRKISINLFNQNKKTLAFQSIAEVGCHLKYNPKKIIKLLITGEID